VRSLTDLHFWLNFRLNVYACSSFYCSDYLINNYNGCSHRPVHHDNRDLASQMTYGTCIIEQERSATADLKVDAKSNITPAPVTCVIRKTRRASAERAVTRHATCPVSLATDARVFDAGVTSHDGSTT